MQRIIYLILFITFLISECFALSKLPQNFEDSVVSYSVLDLNTYEQKAYKRDLPVHPASVMKLLTAYIAYDILGPEFQFKTQLLGKSKDAVYGLKFGGDPTLTLENLQSILDSKFKKARSFKKLELIVDDTIYDEEMYAPGTAYDTQKFFYNAPISAIILNGNAVTYVSDIKDGLYKPEGKELKINLKQSGIQKLDSPLCHFNLRFTGINEYVLEGCVNEALPPMLRIAINNPRKALSDYLKEYFSKLGITVTVKFQKIPNDFSVIYEHSSDKLSRILTDILVYSDNIVADSIAKYIAYKTYNQKATWQLMNKAYLDYISNNLNFDPQRLRIFDGSGLSYSNLLTTNFLIHLLQAIYKDPNKFNFFMSALPYPGGEGTLKKRFEQSPLKLKLRAKTGSMNYVSTLAGFINNEKGYKAFAICINNHTGEWYEIKTLQEKTLEKIFYDNDS